MLCIRTIHSGNATCSIGKHAGHVPHYVAQTEVVSTELCYATMSLTVMWPNIHHIAITCKLQSELFRICQS